MDSDEVGGPNGIFQISLGSAQALTCSKPNWQDPSDPTDPSTTLKLQNPSYDFR